MTTGLAPHHLRLLKACGDVPLTVERIEQEACEQQGESFVWDLFTRRNTAATILALAAQDLVVYSKVRGEVGAHWAITAAGQLVLEDAG